MARSGSCILAIAASSSVFPSALAASALSSRTRSRAGAFSSALNPLDAVSVALVRFARFCVVLVVVLVGAILCAPVRELTTTILSLLPHWLATLVRAVFLCVRALAAPGPVVVTEVDGGGLEVPKLFQ